MGKNKGKNVVKDALDCSWRKFNIAVMNLSEKELRRAIKLEMNGQNRKTFVDRMMQRIRNLASKSAI